MLAANTEPGLGGSRSGINSSFKNGKGEGIGGRKCHKQPQADDHSP